MFRDTYAIEGLISGMSLEDISKTMGHKSVKTTEKHYLPWVKARDERLQHSQTASLQAQGVLGSEPDIAAAATAGS